MSIGARLAGNPAVIYVGMGIVGFLVIGYALKKAGEAATNITGQVTEYAGQVGQGIADTVGTARDITPYTSPVAGTVTGISSIYDWIVGKVTGYNAPGKTRIVSTDEFLNLPEGTPTI